jgi:hypothetical protein
LGPDRAVAAILHTIEKGWQGIREPEEAATAKIDIKAISRRAREQAKVEGTL